MSDSGGSTTNPPDVVDLSMFSTTQVLEPEKREIGDVVDLSTFPSTKALEPGQTAIRETSARDVAYAITAAFAGVILLALIFDFLVVFLMVFRGFPVADLETATTKSFLPLLEKTAAFASSVFGPLLAFILGYYFSEKARQGASDTGKTQ